MCLIKYAFLFRCDECALIVSVDYDDEDEIEEVRNDMIILSCPCGGKCKALRN